MPSCKQKEPGNKKLLLLFIGICSFLTNTAALSGERSTVRSLLEMRQNRVVIQHWDLSCGAAALATVLRHQHGVSVTERSVALGLIDRPEYIAKPHLVRLRNGFSLLDMKRFTDALGFQGVGLGRMNFDDLLEHAPVIVPVTLRGYPHFVVFRGATARKVLLGDPAFGNVAISKAKFMAAWTDYGAIGRVGFVVKSGGAQVPPGALSATAADFVMLR